METLNPTSSLWPMSLDMTKHQCEGTLRQLEITAYTNVISAFRAEGTLTDAKKKILTELRLQFRISVERHKGEIRRAVNSEQLNTVAKQLSGPLTNIEWEIEARKIIPPLRRAPPRTAYKAIADKCSHDLMKTNNLLPNPCGKTGRKEEREDLGATSEETESEDETAGLRYISRDMVPQHINKDLGSHTILPISEKLLIKQREKKAVEEKIVICQPTGSTTPAYKLVGAEKRKRKRILSEKPVEQPQQVKPCAAQSMAPANSPTNFKKIVFMPSATGPSLGSTTSRTMNIPILKGGGNMSKEIINGTSANSQFATANPTVSDPTIAFSTNAGCLVTSSNSTGTISQSGLVTKVLQRSTPAPTVLGPSLCSLVAKPARPRANSIHLQSDGVANYPSRNYTEYTTSVVSTPAHPGSGSGNYVGPSSQLKSSGVVPAKKTQLHVKHELVPRPSILANNTLSIGQSSNTMSEHQFSKGPRPMSKVNNKIPAPPEMIVVSTGTITVYPRNLTSTQSTVAGTRVVSVNSLHAAPTISSVRNSPSMTVASLATKAPQTLRVPAPQIPTQRPAMSNPKGGYIYLQKRPAANKTVKEVPSKIIGKPLSVASGNVANYLQTPLQRTTIGNGTSSGNLLPAMLVVKPPQANRSAAFYQTHSITVVPHNNTTSASSASKIVSSLGKAKQPAMLSGVPQSTTIRLLTKDVDDSSIASDIPQVQTIISSNNHVKMQKINSASCEEPPIATITSAGISGPSYKRVLQPYKKQKINQQDDVEIKFHPSHDADLLHKITSRSRDHTPITSRGPSPNHNDQHAKHNSIENSVTIHKMTSKPELACVPSAARRIHSMSRSSSTDTSCVSEIEPVFNNEHQDHLVEKAIQRLNEGKTAQARTLLYKAGLDLMQGEESSEPEGLTLLDASQHRDSNSVADCTALTGQPQSPLSATFDHVQSSTDIFFDLRDDTSIETVETQLEGKSASTENPAGEML